MLSIKQREHLPSIYESNLHFLQLIDLANVIDIAIHNRYHKNVSITLSPMCELHAHVLHGLVYGSKCYNHEFNK